MIFSCVQDGLQVERRRRGVGGNDVCSKKEGFTVGRYDMCRTWIEILSVWTERSNQGSIVKEKAI